MTDRELLELAAKAATIDCEWQNGSMLLHGSHSPLLQCNCFYWNPIEDDGDALRLAVKIGIDIGRGTHNNRWAVHFASSKVFSENCERNGVQDPYAATRRAIVRAAAEIGKALKENTE